MKYKMLSKVCSKYASKSFHLSLQRRASSCPFPLIENDFDPDAYVKAKEKSEVYIGQLTQINQLCYAGGKR